EAFTAGVVLTRGLDDCLDVYARGSFDALVEARLAPLDPFSKEARDLKRFFFSAASDAELDKQGRVLVPPALIRHGRLGREVVVAGVHDHLEIWDRAAWTDNVTKVEGSADDVAQRLAEKRV
ncbi:MAG: cell division/cell wall cluster transcriptional repressor MraZ, partial [Gaiellaceae bacterium]